MSLWLRASGVDGFWILLLDFGGSLYKRRGVAMSDGEDEITVAITKVTLR